MAASSLLEKIGDFLECQICLETFKHPKVLQCLHTFCQNCLDQMAPNGTNTVVCPTCRGETVLPGEGVVDLKNNFVLANLLELVTSLQKPLVGEITTDGNSNTSFLCSNCDDDNAAHATSRCLNCCEFLCAECVAAHRRLKALRHHVMRDIRAWLAAGQQVGTSRDTGTEPNGHQAGTVYTCAEHTDAEVTTYCEACDLLICDTCSRTEHVRTPHRLVTLHEAAERQREEIKTILADCKRKLGVFSTAIECTVQIARDLQRRTDRAQKDLQNTSREYMRLIQEEQTRLINELHKKKEDKESEMAAHIDSLQRAVDMIRNMCSLADNSLINGSHVDILRAKTQLVNHRQQLDRVSIRNMPIDTSSLRFVPSTEPNVMQNKLGRIED
ncbi:E3 ubiquitin-protein ligase TRIM71-like [Acanthaster planci]|uniref:E3 ubiquitin-protein ligase TRIM71-like n=1 Tax=Acanthaster planci TaxID=133434 RepID=A0A8B7YDN1_ACAPL|nr:E3 ubiquitin-protein ligase TRIM71-like [Acanthaster planci]